MATPGKKIEKIIEASKQKLEGASGSGESNNGQINLQEVKASLDGLELLYEQLGQALQFTEGLSGYLDESTKELRQLRFLRLAATIGIALIVVFLLGLLVCIIYFHQFWFFMQGPYTRAALILGTLTGTIVLATVLARGAFRSTADRSKDDDLPPHIKAILDIAKKFPLPGVGN